MPHQAVNTPHAVVIVGSGSAGHACAAELARQSSAAGAELGIALIDAEPGGPINRTLVTTGVLPGLLTGEQIALPPIPGVERLSGRAQELLLDDSGTRVRGVRLHDGREVPGGTVVIASGSTPRALPASVRVDEALTRAAPTDSAGPLHAVHTVADAARLHEALAAEARNRPSSNADDIRARLVIIGAGFVGTEIADHFAGAGVDTVVIGRGPEPLSAAFGPEAARRLGELHRDRVTAIFDGEVREIGAVPGGARVELSDGRKVVAERVAVAVGSAPDAAWAGFEGAVAVDGRQRVRGSDGAEAPRGLYAAGAVAAHEFAGEAVVIDHWDAARDQGVQAARAILADLGLSDAPDDYVPRSVYHLRAYGHVFSAYGYRPRSAEDRPAPGGQPSESALLFEQLNREGVVAGVVGVDAGAAVRAAAERIGERA